MTTVSSTAHARRIVVWGSDAAPLAEVVLEWNGATWSYIGRCNDCASHQVRRHDLAVALFDLMDHAEQAHDGWRP